MITCLVLYNEAKVTTVLKPGPAGCCDAEDDALFGLAFTEELMAVYVPIQPCACVDQQ